MEMEFPFNALGKYSADEEEMPVHVDALGRQRDPNGTLIVPFTFLRPMDGDDMLSWMRAHGHVALKLSKLFTEVPLC